MPRWPEYKAVHPNCAHRLLPYIWDQKTEQEQKTALKDAQKPFDLDPRGEAERLRYEKVQRENAERLRDRKQWERYKAVLGDEAPKTLSAFRAMKRADSERWQDLTADYRYALKIMRKDAIIMSKFTRSLPIKSEPNTIKDLVDDDGRVKQRREYGNNGLPVKDIDTSDHNMPKHHPFGAHAHDWEGVAHGDARELTDQERQHNKDILEGR